MATMPSPVITLRTVMTFVLVIGLTTLVRADLLMDLNDTPPGRCNPEPEDVTATRSSSSAECNLLYSSVPFGGECHGLLQRGPCSVNHWVVLDNKTGRATCQFQVCPDHQVLVSGGCSRLERATCQFQVCPDHQVLVSGGCTRLGRAASSHHCPKTLQLIINEYGEAECECPLGRIYHSPSGKCYDPYEKGPCEDGNILQLVEKDGKIFSDCVPSLCSASGQVPVTSKCELAKFSETTQGDGSYKCYSLISTGPCSTGFLVLDRTMLNVLCTFNHPYGVFDFLTGGMPCMPGSSRDSKRDCRMIMLESVSVAVMKALPTVEPGVFDDGNVCPTDYVFLAGMCLHTQSGH